MTVAVKPTRARPVADPFGMWYLRTDGSSVRGARGEMVSFSLGGGGELGGFELPAALWMLPLTSDLTGLEAGEEELERRNGKIQAITAGLDEASERADTLLSARAVERETVSFAVGELEETLPLAAPEASLMAALRILEPASVEEPVSFGLGQPEEQIANAETAGIHWDELRQRLDSLLDSVNRQLLHFAWVDTTLDGCLVARTAVNWGGDVVTLWQPGLSPEISTAHCRSLDLAMQSRAANLRAILTVSQVAGKIALAVTTPLGPLQAMSLGWQFVYDVLLPILKQTK